MFTAPVDDPQTWMCMSPSVPFLWLITEMPSPFNSSAISCNVISTPNLHWRVPSYLYTSEVCESKVHKANPAVPTNPVDTVRQLSSVIVYIFTDPVGAPHTCGNKNGTTPFYCPCISPPIADSSFAITSSAISDPIPHWSVPSNLNTFTFVISAFPFNLMRVIPTFHLTIAQPTNEHVLTTRKQYKYIALFSIR